MEAARPAGKTRKKRIRAEKGGIDLTFMFLVLILLAIGLIMLFSASYASAYYETGNSFYYISRQLLFAIVGIIGMFVVANIDYHILHRFAFLIYIGTVFLLILVLFVHTREDARRWIPLGFTTFQPSELAKFAVVLIFAHLISTNYDKMKDPKYGVWPFLALMGIVVLLMLLEPHLSGTILILSIGIIMMFVGGTDLKWFMIGGLLLAAAVVVIVLIPGVIPYAMSRIQHWRDPWIDPQGKGFQTIQSLYAIGSGGLMGVGIGNSRQKHLYLPEPQNDFIFSVVCEELGFIGATLIILVFVLLIWRGYVIAMRCRDRFGSMLAIGLTTQVGVQTILNIAVVSNTIPNTGISLPFFSSGGTALVMLLAEMGVILSVSRQTNLEKE
ncbi:MULTISPECIES: putative lipid II flippase FtsW [Anaerotruncus]|uniref:Probable peptidoglycan glycosyltransferase FtsW n=2 Tax=Anaerotruncus TaxID=244127 RepID=A0A498CTG6_9FIRM|nr:MULTISPECIES: putative lipid II flippase FtsW [Anaerotruncus]MBC3939395.1 putative lipid II flippase FtsW [Anaerotruncus massiliensis (ex Togo et al. 2019)]MCQ4896184.1 putative lipid II flippase FtsW [Anaerotruncus sp. DFI.9.16]RLL09125.1 putative lipid II flippase FtsW [Anaerotruncus massiliensis (ex Liu et al. 2021)]